MPPRNDSPSTAWETHCLDLANGGCSLRAIARITGARVEDVTICLVRCRRLVKRGTRAHAELNVNPCIRYDFRAYERPRQRGLRRGHIAEVIPLRPRTQA
jgi:hypothetical protein